MSSLEIVIKNIKETLARPIENPKLRAILEAKLKVLEDSKAIRKN